MARRIQVDTLLQQAQTAFDANDLTRTKAICEGLLRHDARNFMALGLMGRIALAGGETANAVSFFSRCVGAQPKDPRGHLSLGEALAGEGRFRDAIAAFDRVLRLAPRHMLAIARKADAAERLGDRRWARAVLAPFVAGGGETPEMAVVQAKLELHDRNHQAIVDMVARHTDAGPLVRRHLLALLGKARERESRFEEAFDSYRCANDLVDVPFDPGLWDATTDQLIEVFSAARLAATPRARHGSPLPVFIVGMPRSGSTLIETILDAHPDAHGAGEVLVIPEIVNEMPLVIGSDLPYPACVEDLAAQDIDAISRSCLQRLTALNPRARRIVDKYLPNYLHLGVIALLFPEARVIHARRHPLDTCLSCYSEPLIPVANPYASDLGSLGAVYLAYERLMTHWREVLDIPFLDVQYEALVADQERLSRRIVEFCGLDWDDRCLRYYESARVVHTLSYDQVTRPVYTSSVGRYRNFETQLEPLRKVLVEGGVDLEPWNYLSAR